ncbi:hypothetical protein LTR53_010007 [Teratosphaeriaceae sp. CCFEE 6253]|nr:hypothetical protein LTR53_010007 [Teratosphaeriaceae sp. CCFEE 6253]
MHAAFLGRACSESAPQHTHVANSSEGRGLGPSPWIAAAGVACPRRQADCTLPVSVHNAVGTGGHSARHSASHANVSTSPIRGTEGSAAERMASCVARGAARSGRSVAGSCDDGLADGSHGGPHVLHRSCTRDRLRMEKIGIRPGISGAAATRDSDWLLSQGPGLREAQSDFRLTYAYARRAVLRPDGETPTWFGEAELLRRGVDAGWVRSAAPWSRRRRGMDAEMKAYEAASSLT